MFGICRTESGDIARQVYHGLYALQHRGQESCGIAVNDDDGILCYKDTGLVAEVFDEQRLASMRGKIAIGHVRYSTTGENTRENAQPLATKYVKGTLTIVHNGNIVNAVALRRELEQQGAIFQTTNDTEVIAFLIARERLHAPSIEAAVSRVVPKLTGSFSLLVMSPKKLIAVRDPFGIRPLCMGKLPGGVLFASESCAFGAVGAQLVRDVAPGEIIVVSNGEIRSDRSHCQGGSSLCIFEHIYFARPDSVIDSQSVYRARLEAGRLLYQTHPVDADLVTGVPDSGIIAAIGFSRASGIPYGEGFVKNRYIGRTFIQPTQEMRESSVNIKLSPLACNVKDKRVVLIDDSIVRGTTMSHIVALLRRAGAKEVHVRISAPPFLWPCYFGTDIPDREELVSNHYTPEQLSKKIGADSIGFLTPENIREIAPDSSVGFCTACFSGKYPFPVPQKADKLALKNF